MNSDVLCLTETQLLPDHDTHEICFQLKEFNVSFNNDDDKFQSIFCGVKVPTLIVSHDKFPGFSILTISKDTFLDCNFTVGVLYRKHSSSLNLFYDHLIVLVNTYGIDILVGDFNINYFDKQDLLNDALSDYAMIVTTPTHIDGSLLDHIYVKNQVLADFNVRSMVKNIFFSDHDVVKIKIAKKI